MPPPGGRRAAACRCRLGAGLGRRSLPSGRPAAGSSAWPVPRPPSCPVAGVRTAVPLRRPRSDQACAGSRTSMVCPYGPAWHRAVSGERRRVVVMGPARTAARPPSSLSPSRAGDFMQCPLLYRFRVIDRLPEKPSEAATPGHAGARGAGAALRRPGRRADRAAGPVDGPGPVGPAAGETRPELAELFAGRSGGRAAGAVAGEAEQLVERWFTLEDPTPAGARRAGAVRGDGAGVRADAARHHRPGGRGARRGEVRIVDYKTGKAPRPEYAEGALFQMKFYALVLWRLREVVPRRLQLVYLGSGDVLTYDPVEADLVRGRAQAAGAVGGDQAGDGVGRLAAPPDQAVRLVRPPGGLPGVRRHSPAVSAGRLRAGRPERPGLSGGVCRRAPAGAWGRMDG